MARSRKDEQRYLSQDEQDLVDRTHLPALKLVETPELVKLRKTLRDRRDKARDVAHQQRREMRGKAAPRGAAPATGNEGTKAKRDIIAAAVKRVNRELERRRAGDAREALLANARKAFMLKTAAEEAGKPRRPNPGRTAGKGMRNVANRKPEQIADPREAGRVSQFVKNAQARRDSP